VAQDYFSCTSTNSVPVKHLHLSRVPYFTLHAMKIISERGKAENIYNSYQKQEKVIALTNENKSVKSGNSKKTTGTTENNTIKSKAAPKQKAKEVDDSEDGGEEGDSGEVELGHAMPPPRTRMDVQVTSTYLYAPIQELTTAHQRLLLISIDDAIGTLRIHVNTDLVIRGTL
jgi:hypothetical protein